MRRVITGPVDRHAGPPRGASRRFVPLLVVLLASPFLIDGARLYYSKFAALSGPVPIAQTPAFDLAESYIGETSDALRRLAKHPFRRLPWSPQWTVGALALSLAAGSLIIRINRPR